MSCRPTPLGDGYTAEFDTVDKNKWDEIIDQFADANIYQTWSYDAIRCGERNISHFILRSDGDIVAGAQARIVRIPFLRIAAAYIRWAPIWRRRDQPANLAIFHMAIRALRNEYVCRRRMILRLLPALFEDNSDSFLDILRREGYARISERNRSRTLVLDISPPIEELRKKLNQKWRNCLNRAERNELELIEGTEDSLFAEFIGIYQNLLRRKMFPEPNDIDEFRMIQRDLPCDLKMKVFLCRSKGLSSAGAICTAIGDTGVYLFGATTEQGMINKGSYMTQWKAIEWLKKIGCRNYNLNGINPSANPGTYHFKVGLSGKDGKDVYYIGRFDCYPSVLYATWAKIADFAFPIIKKITSIYR
jgi:hypothetical protein